MPRLAPTPCTHPGCGNYAIDRTGRCDDHPRAARIKRGYADGKTTDRGYGYGWRKLRAAVLTRDKGLCQVCADNGRTTAATQVDHVTPKSRGGSDDMGNLQAICVACHRNKTARES